MIHDILLSLTGLVGDKIVVDPEEFVSSSISLYSYRYSLRLKSSVRECLSETESSLVDRILGVSSNFYSVNEFVRRVQGSVYNRHANYNSNSTFGFETGVGRGRDLQIRADLNRRLLRINPVGLYIHAVARCMQEYIVRFLQKISQLEREVFENPNLPLTFVLASITKPARVLEHFMAFIDEWYTLAINSRVDSTCRFSFSNMFITMERFENVCEIYISVPCGYILDYFYSGISSGDLLQESVSRNFLLVCCRVFCYQMVNWIALGKLVDPFEEFIVGRFSISASAHPSGAKSGPASSEPFSLPSNDSCVEALDMEENTCRLYSREEAIHCGVFEWEGLFYTRFESFTKKLFALKFQYKVFGVGKIVSFVRTGLLERLSDLCPSQLQVRLLSRYGDESVRARVSGAGLQGHLEQVSSILNESFPHIQPQLEGLLEKFRREISSLMYSSILADGLPAPGEACTSLQAPENTLQQSIQLVRDLYFLGNSDLFLQLDHSIFHKSMGSDEPPTRNSNIGEQLEFVSAAWRDALTSARLSGAWASTHGISESRVSICCDTFDLFSFGLSETELVESFNCQISDTTLHLGGKPGLHADPKLESGQDRPEGAGSLGVVQEGVDVASMCRIRWPIRIIDGFNHVLECVSSLDVVSSLLFTASGGLPLRGGRLVGLGEGDPESTGEFLRLTWGFGFKDRTRQVLEFSIRLYWHTKNLKSLLNTEDDFSLLKTNVLEVPNPQVGLYAYRLRILFKQSNISVYMEPLKTVLADSGSLFARPTQVLSIQHINIDICLPLQTSSSYIHLLRHGEPGMALGEGERELRVVKWCHISSSGSSDVISQLAGSTGAGSSASASYNYNLLSRVALNSYLSGVSFDHHIFRLRIVQGFGWPLPLLFTKRNMEHYYNLFDFYWLFFRTYNGLERLWREAFNLRYGSRRGLFSSFSLEHPVNHFWNYIFYCRWVLQVTIGEYYSFLQHFAVDQSLNEFLDRVKEERDFEKIIQGHRDLVQTLTLRSGLLLPSVLSPLTSILVLTSEWSHLVFRELQRWNELGDLAESRLLFQGPDSPKLPWRSGIWASLIENTVQFMNNFVLLWDSLCSEISIVSSNIQYQHLSFLLSVFSNNRWNIDVPDLGPPPGRDLASLPPSPYSNRHPGDEEYDGQLHPTPRPPRPGPETYDSEDYIYSDYESDSPDPSLGEQGDLEDDAPYPHTSRHGLEEEAGGENRPRQYSPSPPDHLGTSSLIERLSSKLGVTSLQTPSSDSAGRSVWPRIPR